MSLVFYFIFNSVVMLSVVLIILINYIFIFIVLFLVNGLISSSFYTIVSSSFALTPSSSVFNSFSCNLDALFMYSSVASFHLIYLVLDSFVYRSLTYFRVCLYMHFSSRRFQLLIALMYFVFLLVCRFFVPHFAFCLLEPRTRTFVLIVLFCFALRAAFESLPFFRPL